MQRIVHSVAAVLEQAGGTVGGLLNIERNVVYVVFKALVRYTIKQDELKRPGAYAEEDRKS